MCIDRLTETDDRITENCRKGIELLKTTNPNSTKHTHAFHIRWYGCCYKDSNIGILVSHIIPKFCHLGRLKILGPLAFIKNGSTILAFMVGLFADSLLPSGLFVSPRFYPEETRSEAILQETVPEPHPEVEPILGKNNAKLLEVLHTIF